MGKKSKGAPAPAEDKKFPRGIDEVRRAAERSGQLVEVTQRGSHVKFRAKNGKSVIAPDRNEYPAGTRKSIRKMMAACGFIIFVIVVCLGAFAFLGA